MSTVILNILLAGTVSGVVQLQGDVPRAGGDKPTLDIHACGKEMKPDRDKVVKADGSMAHVVVTLAPKKHKVKSTVPKKVSMDQKACEFMPFVVVAAPGGSLEVSNSDPSLHNVHMRKGRSGKSLKNIAQPAKNPPVKIKLETKGPIRIECDIHYWMTAWAYVTEDPFGTVTDADGKFEFKDVPDGEYTLTTWHVMTGRSEQSVTVKAESNTDVTVKVVRSKNN